MPVFRGKEMDTAMQMFFVILINKTIGPNPAVSSEKEIIYAGNQDRTFEIGQVL